MIYTLRKIVSLASRFHDLKKEKNKIESQIKEIKNELDELRKWYLYGKDNLSSDELEDLYCKVQQVIPDEPMDTS